MHTTVLCRHLEVRSRIVADTATVRGELARADAQASALAGIAAAALTILLAAQSTTRPPAPVTAVIAAAAVATAAAIVLLALVLHPNLGTGRGGWLGYADLTPEQVRDRVIADSVGLVAAAQLAYLARVGRTKYRRIRAAVRLLLVVVFLALAAAGLDLALTAGR